MKDSFCVNFSLVNCQAQSGWSQHDYGHMSVMKTSRLNHWMHLFVICHLKVFIAFELPALSVHIRSAVIVLFVMLLAKKKNNDMLRNFTS